MATPGQAALIGIDWGTTSLRAWMVAADGEVLESRRFDLGILRVPDGDFAAAFAESFGDWHVLGLPALMSGMIGSRQGWVEAPYVACPTDLAALGSHLTSPPGQDRVWIVPGLSLKDGDRRDVMRGEETQIAGAVGDGSGVAVLPGTHSKWVSVEHGRITDFQTFMTGELFDVLRRHSILGRLMPETAASSDDGFSRGVTSARDSEGGLSGALFSTRALGLFGGVPADALSDYLSGLLIGHELREALQRFPARDVLLIGSAALTARYATALDLFGIATRSADEAAAVKGLIQIARHAGLLQGTAR
jgi:2-dehydro-3-deoxygalactonokinase